ncbi:bacterio-opsin activator domain-containing protein [Natrialbaceae archaeon GCM10025810]|uniref:bacterio-opsin activator domain-containing protein n=1 Tax=Halovalidus salilacus TaxID=3075124 RepID=UPI00360C2AF9
MSESDTGLEEEADAETETKSDVEADADRFATDGHQILLIEDNPGDARLIEEMLRESDELSQRIDSSVSGETPTVRNEQRLEKGLSTLQSTDVDVVLLDLNLPDSTGFRTLEVVTEATDHVPIVVLTGLSDQQAGIQAIQRGAHDFLVKDEVTSTLLVRTIHHAIERARQERERLERRRQMEALNRLNRIGHDITHAVITTETRAELEQRVCDRLAASDAYRFAWIGEVNPGSNEVVPRAAAGVEDGYLEEIEITTSDGETGKGPTGTAIRTGQVQITHDTRSDSNYEPWRETAAEHGYRSSAAIPIIYEDLVYGSLNVYSEMSNAFTGPETAVLARMGDVIAHAITALDRKDALVSDAVVELEFQMDDIAEPLLELTRDEEGATIRLERLIRGDETLLAYGTAREVSQERLEEAVAETEGLSDVRFLTGGGDEYEFELVAPIAVSLFETVATHGGRVQSATVADGEFRFVVELPRGRDTRQLIELIQERHADITYMAQRTRERTSSDSSPRSVLDRRLTDKQRAALETAYFAGYFDWPRGSTGEEIAERLGISPATFNQHLRTAERKFFDSLFEEERRPDGE